MLRHTCLAFFIGTFFCSFLVNAVEQAENASNRKSKVTLNSIDDSLAPFSARFNKHHRCKRIRNSTLRLNCIMENLTPKKRAKFAEFLEKLGRDTHNRHDYHQRAFNRRPGLRNRRGRHQRAFGRRSGFRNHHGRNQRPYGRPLGFRNRYGRSNRQGHRHRLGRHNSHRRRPRFARRHSLRRPHRLRRRSNQINRVYTGRKDRK